MIFYSQDTVHGIFACDFTAVLQVTRTHDMMHLEICILLYSLLFFFLLRSYRLFLSSPTQFIRAYDNNPRPYSMVGDYLS